MNAIDLQICRTNIKKTRNMFWWFLGFDIVVLVYYFLWCLYIYYQKGTIIEGGDGKFIYTNNDVFERAKWFPIGYRAICTAQAVVIVWCTAWITVYSLSTIIRPKEGLGWSARPLISTWICWLLSLFYLLVIIIQTITAYNFNFKVSLPYGHHDTAIVAIVAFALPALMIVFGVLDSHSVKNMKVDKKGNPSVKKQSSKKVSTKTAKKETKPTKANTAKSKSANTTSKTKKISSGSQKTKSINTKANN